MGLPRLPLPPPPAALAVLALAFVLPGLAGHDPWKSHDAIGIGIVHAMALGGDLLVPQVAGQRWLSDGPLYHWVALLFGKALGALLEFHAAARLASGAFVLAAFWLAHRAAGEWSPEPERPGAAATAFLVLLGSVGLMVHAHEALPELAALAALCGALACLPRSREQPARSGALFGAALGVAFLSGSWIAPAALGLAVLAAHLACPAWRTSGRWPFLAAAAALALLIAGSWPLLLALRSPELAAEWWRHSSTPQGSAAANLRYFAATGAWFAWPAWPLAAWALWSLRRRLEEPRLFVPAAAAVATFLCIGFWGPPQDVNLIPLLAPLALLAGQGVATLRRGAAAALDWFGVLTFAFFAGLVWLGYSGMMTGLPPKVAANFARGAPGFVPQFEFLPLLVALAITAGWLYVALAAAPSPSRAIVRWAAGITLLWGTFAMLWMPWADFQKSYRSVALQLRSRLPADAGCLAQRSLGLPQAAALEYHAALRTQPFDPLRPEACRWLLIQGNPRQEAEVPGPRWTKVADVGRPGDKLERHRLYRLTP